MTALPGGEEWHAAPGGISANGAADIEMAAALALARLAEAFAQAPRDLTDQQPHLRDLTLLQPRHRRIAQDLVA